MNEEELLMQAIKAAVDAGKAINQIYRAGFSVEYKTDASPLTTADIAAHKIIKNLLSETPLPMLSEEEEAVDYEIRKHWKRYWLCDPLDGTKEFISGNGEFTVNIALIEEGRPVMGIVYAPVPDLLYFADERLGAWKMSEVRQIWDGQSSLRQLIHLSQALPLAREERPFTVLCSRSHLNAETSAYIDTLKLRFPDLAQCSRGSSLKFCTVAEGSADAYPRFSPTMEWDTAAGHAIAACAGASVIAQDTNLPMVYNKEHLLNPGFVVTFRQ
jgi:3'(2'), 5'-bisphosphate nucleotidase